MKKVLIGVGIVLVGYLLLCLVGSKTMRVERSQLMSHSAEAVYEQVISFENWEHWSPWMQMDTNIQLIYTGKEGVGSSASWKSKNEMVGSGNQTIVEVVPQESVWIDLEFDGQGSAQAYFAITTIDTSTTEIKWGFLMETPFLARGFMQFIDLDSELGPMYEMGLNSMNNYLKEKKQLEEVVLNSKRSEELPATNANRTEGHVESVTEIKTKNRTPEIFINGEEGRLLNDVAENDLTNRAFDYISMDKIAGGVCEELDLGNNVVLENDHNEKAILVRMSIVWKDINKKKVTIYKAYEMAPLSEMNIGCTHVTIGNSTKVKWNVIHTAYK